MVNKRKSNYANFKLKKLVFKPMNTKFILTNVKKPIVMSTNENQPMDENFYIEKELREFQEAKDRREMREGKQNLGSGNGIGVNADSARQNSSELGEEHGKHEEHHVNRKYKMFTTHNSSHDQPKTNTGPGTV